MSTKPTFTEEELKKRLEKSRPVQREEFFKHLTDTLDQTNKKASTQRTAPDKGTSSRHKP